MQEENKEAYVRGFFSWIRASGCAELAPRQVGPLINFTPKVTLQFRGRLELLLPGEEAGETAEEE